MTTKNSFLSFENEQILGKFLVIKNDHAPNEGFAQLRFLVPKREKRPSSRNDLSMLVKQLNRNCSAQRLPNCSDIVQVSDCNLTMT